MAEREQIRKPAPNERENETADSPSASERGEELKAELDDLRGSGRELSSGL